MNPFQVHRSERGYDTVAASEHFRKYGIVVLKNLLPAATRQPMREALERQLAIATSEGAVQKHRQYPDCDFLLGDVLAVRALEEYDFLFFSSEVFGVLKALLNTNELVYWGDSNIQFGEAARGFHKDNVDRNDGTKGDWTEPYGLLRCGFYMQDHTVHSGGLKVRLGSHNIPNHLEGRSWDVESEYGDLVIWNMRLTHSGNNRRLRFAPGIALHPRFENMVPSWMRRPEAQRRVAAFCSFARPGTQLDRYIEWMGRRGDYKPYFQRARKRDDAAVLATRYGFSFRVPADGYGELDRAV